MSKGAEAKRGATRRLRSRDGVVLPAWSVRGLAAVLMLVAAGMPWLAQWQGAVALPEPEVVEDDERIVVELRPQLVRVPEGSFRMGSSPRPQEPAQDDAPQHTAYVAAFEICRTEVTQGQWHAVMGPQDFACTFGCGDDHPAHDVVWNEAVAFMNALTQRENALRAVGEPMTPCYAQEGDSWRWSDPRCTGYRLPTETEWEYAARADTTTAYGFGDDATALAEHAWYADDAGMQAHSVGTKAPNPWGLYDVHGNVWEWVWDLYAAYEPGVTDMGYVGPKDGQLRVLRGGSFRDEAARLRTTARHRLLPSLTDLGVGFRCARSLSPPEPATRDLGDAAAAG